LTGISGETAILNDAHDNILTGIQEMWAIVYGIAARYGIRNHETFARRAHGVSPRVAVRTWLPEKYRDVNALRENISADVKHAITNELEDLALYSGAALVEARRRK